jgi:hypothetical protein
MRLTRNEPVNKVAKELTVTFLGVKHEQSSKKGENVCGCFNVNVGIKNTLLIAWEKLAK